MRDSASIAAAAALVLTARSSLADHYEVPTGSMLPTVHIGDHVLVNKAAYGLRFPLSDARLIEGDGPERGDVVVLESPENDKVLLKRVIGLPGDQVTVRQGRITINDVLAPIEETEAGLVEVLGRAHPVSFAHGGGPDVGPIELPPGKVLVMGDNRGNSRDGRSFGLVDRSRILGRVAGAFYRDGELGWTGL